MAPPPPRQRPLRTAELFSGLGGWRLAAEGLLEVVVAVDHSDQCNAVYRHNFGGEAPLQRRIETLEAKDLGDDIECLLMSPPCQPYTRQHELRDDDPRGAALRRVLELVKDLPRLKLVCLENVVGFERSQVFRHLRQSLTAADWRLTAWHLSPTMIGVPNERPRLFFTAVRTMASSSSCSSLEEEQILLLRRWPVPMEDTTPRPVSDYLEEEADETSDDFVLRVPEDLLEKSKAWCLDVVDGSATSTACFTRSYGRFVRGTGSVLCVGAALPSDLGLSSPEARRFDREWRKKLPTTARLRYFAPREIANLLGFPRSFHIPDDLMSHRAKWAALGNALHVDAARAVITYALHHLPPPFDENQ